MSCPNNAACPGIHYCEQCGVYIVVGTRASNVHAETAGGNVGPDEQAVIVPADVIAQHEKPLRDRIAELEARPIGIIQIDGPLTEEQAEEAKRRFLAAPIRRVTYPEIDYPQELRDQHSGSGLLERLAELAIEAAEPDAAMGDGT